MKKLLVFFLCALMVFSMVASVSAATINTVKPTKTYAAAKDGDLLYKANFKTDGFGALNDNTVASYTASADGSSVTIKGTTDKVANWWGIKVDGLTAANGEKYTITYKAKANGTSGKNNSVGIGALYSGASETAAYQKFYNAYGNHNTVDDKGSTADRRVCIELAATKIGDYSTAIQKFDEDKDGFISMKQELDISAKKMRIYALVGAKWALILEKDFTDYVADKAFMGFSSYAYYAVVDTIIKDYKIYKGVGLTDAQLNPVETTAATTKAPTTKPASPATFDAAVVLAVVASMAGAGVVVSKKRK